MRTYVSCLAVLAIVFAAALSSPTASYAVPAYSLNLPSGQPVDGDSGKYTMGFEFTTGQAFNIDALGYNANDQFAGVHRVGIFETATQTLLFSADVTVPSGNSNLEDFVYQSLNTPFVLPAGTYRLAGTTYNYPTSGSAHGYIFTNDNSHYMEASGIIYGDGTFTSSTGDLVFPSTSASNNFYNVNFQFSEIPPPPAPEPTSLALCTLALCGMAIRRRRRLGTQVNV
jgi:hypothetical protein